MANTFTNYPEDHTKDVRPRLKAYCVVTDDDEFSSITIKVNDKFAYDDGAFLPNYEGTVVAEGLTKLTFRFIPLSYWQSNTKYTIEVVWQNGVAGKYTETWDFTTGTYCFEDDLPTPSTMDQAIMTGFVSSQCERLRQALMLVCTDSAEQLVQARTIIWLSSMTELRTILAGTLDFDLVEDLHLCDRRGVVPVLASLRTYLTLAKKAVDELKLKKEAKALLRDYLESRSPIYVVNAVAAIVVLATRGLNL